MSDDDLGAAVPLDGDRLDALERLAEKATPGAWAVLDLADAVFDSEDNRGWWWVWRAGCEHYAGILEVQSTYKASAEKTLVGCSIGEAQITDATRGDVERADAELIAATDPPTVLALVAALRASWAEVERLREVVAEEQAHCTDERFRLAEERDEARAALAAAERTLAEQTDLAEQSWGVASAAIRLHCEAASVVDRVRELAERWASDDEVLEWNPLDELNAALAASRTGTADKGQVSD